MQDVHAFQTISDQLMTMPKAIDSLLAVDAALAAAPDRVLTLPRETSWLMPVVDYFGGDTPDYLVWVTKVRDERKRNPRAEDKPEVRDLARTVYQRHTMRDRRRRLDQGRLVAEYRDNRTIEGADRRKFEAGLIRAWMRERDEHVAQATGDTPPDYDRRRELYAEYWAALDAALAAAVEQVKKDEAARRKGRK